MPNPTYWMALDEIRIIFSKILLILALCFFSYRLYLFLAVSSDAINAFYTFLAGLAALLLAGALAYLEYGYKASSYSENSETIQEFVLGSYIEFENTRPPLDEEAIQKNLNERLRNKNIS